MTPSALELVVHLPSEFVLVLGPAQAEVEVEPSWTVDAQARRAQLRTQVDASALRGLPLLCAVHAEVVDGEEVRTSLVVSATALSSRDLDLDRLYERARERTSERGRVSRLTLPTGAAIGAVDVVAPDASIILVERDASTGTGRLGGRSTGLLGLVELDLPLPHLGQLVRLTAWTTDDAAVPACSRIVADIAGRLRLDGVA